MSPWTNVSTLKALWWAWGSGEEGAVWLPALQCPAVLLMLQARAPGSSQLEHSLWKPGLEQLCPQSSSLLASSIGTSLEMSINKWKWLLPGVRCCLHPAHGRHLKPLLVWNFFHGFTEWIWFHIHPLFFSFGKGTGSAHIHTIAESLCNYFCTVVTHPFEYIPAFLFTFKAILIEDVAVAGSIMRMYLSIKWVYFLWFGWNSAELM